jgi:hypothetical protein
MTKDELRSNAAVLARLLGNFRNKLHRPAEYFNRHILGDCSCSLHLSRSWLMPSVFKYTPTPVDSNKSCIIFAVGPFRVVFLYKVKGEI